MTLDAFIENVRRCQLPKNIILILMLMGYFALIWSREYNPNAIVILNNLLLEELVK